MIDLVTSVPDLHTARILASGGVSYISFLQTNPNLNEIIPWIEGPEIFVQLTDVDLPIPQVRGLIIPYEWYDQFSFIDKKIFWLTDRNVIPVSSGLIYTDRDIIPDEDQHDRTFYHQAVQDKYNRNDLQYWFDYDQDLNLFEKIFLD